MKNKNIALAGLLVLILAGVGYVLFTGKTTLFKGQLGGFGEKDGKGGGPVSAEACAEDDRSCWSQVQYDLEVAVSRQETLVQEVKQKVYDQETVVKEKAEALKRQAQVVKSLEKKVTLAKKKVQKAKDNLVRARVRVRRDPQAVARAEEELRAAEAELETAKRDAQNARDQYNTMKQELDAATEELNRRKAEYERLNNELIDLRNLLKAAREAYEHAWEIFVPNWRFCYDTHQLSFETELPHLYDAALEKCQDLFPEVMAGGPDVSRCARMKQKEMEGSLTPGDRRLYDNCRAAYPFAFGNLSVERCEQYRQWAEEGVLTPNGYDPALFRFCQEIYPDIMFNRAETEESGRADVPEPRDSGPDFGPPPSEEFPSEPESTPIPESP